MDLIEEIRKQVGLHCFGNVRTEKAIEILVNNFFNQSKGQRITFFFPEWYCNLKPVSVYGQVPQKGDKIFIGNWRFDVPDEQHYKAWQSWEVRDVCCSVNVETDTIEATRMSVNGLTVNSYEYQVRLHKGRKW